MPLPRSARASLAALVAWLLPLAAAAALRFHNLPRQILLDDEMHTVATALYAPLREILSSFKSEDPCLPLTALYRMLLEWGVPFSEMTFRLPVAVVGLLAVVALPGLALPAIGRRAAILLAWLLALSPVLAIYGGMVRPYGVIALLAPAAALLALRWRASGGIGWGIAYAAIAALCLWFHLGTAPVLAAPFGFIALEKAATRREVPSWRALAMVGATALALVAAFIVPAWDSLRALYAVKSGIAPFSFELVPPILRLQAGAASSWAAVPFWAVAAAGVVALARRRPAIAIFVLAVTIAQWVGLAILAPIGLLNPIIFNRYLIGTLPLVLILVAVGLASIMAAIAPRSETPRPAEPSAAPRRWASWAVPALFLAFLAATGPYADPEFRRSSFRHSKDFIRFDLPRARLEEAAVPLFYRAPALLEHGVPVAEFPFRGGWSATRTHYVYQTMHAGAVLAVEPYRWPCDRRLRLRNHVCPEPYALLESEARFLVVHRDALAEELLLEGGDDSGNRYSPEEWTEMVGVARRFARNLRRRWGPPAYSDQRTVVWDLDAVRARRASMPPRRRSDAEPR